MWQALERLMRCRWWMRSNQATSISQKMENTMKHREGVRRPAGEETDRRDGLPGSQLPEKIFVDDRWFRFRLNV